MSASTSRLAYQDAYDILDQAVENSVGIRVQVPDEGAGFNLRLRLHQARSIVRKENKEIYPEDHKLYGRSIYDPLVIRIKKEATKWWMYIEKMSAESLTIEPLGEDNGIDQPAESNLPAPSGAGGSEPPNEAPTEEIEIFDQNKARPAEPAAPESPAPVQARRRV